MIDLNTGIKIVGNKALELSIQIAQEACYEVSKILKAPHNFEYEKSFMPFCLLSKKRYVGIKYELTCTNGKRVEMGNASKRRGICPFVKDIYGGIIDILMNEKNIQKAIHYVKESLDMLVNGQIKIDKLIITKSLSSNYKNPQSIPHKVLADRMYERDPGNKFCSGDRIPYVFFVQKNNKIMLQGERIEHPTFVQEHNLPIDYTYYITNQIMNPIMQVFGLVIEQIWLSQKPPRKKKVIELQQKTKTIWESIIDESKKIKKIDKLRESEVKKILFEPYIVAANNLSHSQKPIDQFLISK